MQDLCITLQEPRLHTVVVERENQNCVSMFDNLTHFTVHHLFCNLKFKRRFNFIRKQKIVLPFLRPVKQCLSTPTHFNSHLVRQHGEKHTKAGV